MDERAAVQRTPAGAVSPGTDSRRGAQKAGGGTEADCAAKSAAAMTSEARGDRYHDCRLASFRRLPLNRAGTLQQHQHVSCANWKTWREVSERGGRGGRPVVNCLRRQRMSAAGSNLPGSRTAVACERRLSCNFLPGKTPYVPVRFFTAAHPHHHHCNGTSPSTLLRQGAVTCRHT